MRVFRGIFEAFNWLFKQLGYIHPSQPYCTVFTQENYKRKQRNPKKSRPKSQSFFCKPKPLKTKRDFRRKIKPIHQPV